MSMNVLAKLRVCVLLLCEADIKLGSLLHTLTLCIQESATPANYEF